MDRIVVFDVETQRLIPDGARTPATLSSAGWACVCAAEMLVDEHGLHQGDYYVFLEGNATDILALFEGASLVTGFNIEGFDLPFLEGYFEGLGLDGVDLNGDLRGEVSATSIIKRLPTYDLLYYCRRAIGWKPHQRYPKGLKLDEVLQATFNGKMNKTGEGAMAPELYSRGEMGKLVTYCLADVRREAALFEQAWRGFPVSAAMHGSFTLQHPRDRMQIKEERK